MRCYDIKKNNQPHSPGELNRKLNPKAQVGSKAISIFSRGLGCAKA